MGASQGPGQVGVVYVSACHDELPATDVQPQAAVPKPSGIATSNCSGTVYIRVL